MSDEKTEEPSESKLRKVRQEGQVAKSSDVVEVACLAAVFIALQSSAERFAATLRAVVSDALDFLAGPRSMQDLLYAFADMGRHTIELMFVVTGLSLAAAVLALLPQTGLQISMAGAAPKLETVSPGAGFKRIFSMTSLLDLGKMSIKAALILVVMWQTIKSAFPVVASALDHSIPQLSATLWSVLMHIVAVAVCVFAVIGAVDYKLQSWLFVRRNRMSKDELKRESKENDGNPEVKGERKRLAKELSQEEPKRGVGRANVLVVNPSHYAVALRYDPREFPLPAVIARGLDAEALLLRRYATELAVPIVANPPVARMLYRVPQDQPIPEELFEVVAAILRWVDGLTPRPASAAAAVAAASVPTSALPGLAPAPIPAAPSRTISTAARHG